MHECSDKVEQEPHVDKPVVDSDPPAPLPSTLPEVISKPHPLSTSSKKIKQAETSTSQNTSTACEPEIENFPDSASGMSEEESYDIEEIPHKQCFNRLAISNPQFLNQTLGFPICTSSLKWQEVLFANLLTTILLNHNAVGLKK